MSLYPGTPIHLVLAMCGWFALAWAWWSGRVPRSSDQDARRGLWGAALLTLVTFVVGSLLYPAYRSELKPDLLVQAPMLASLFESKEHLAAMTLCLVLGSAGVQTSAGQLPEGRRASRALLALGWLLYSVVAGLGVLVTWTG